MKLTYGPSTQYPIVKTLTLEEGGDQTHVIVSTQAHQRVNDYINAVGFEQGDEPRDEGQVKFLSDLGQLVEQMMAALTALETISELDGTGGAERVARDALEVLQALEEGH